MESKTRFHDVQYNLISSESREVEAQSYIISDNDGSDEDHTLFELNGFRKKETTGDRDGVASKSHGKLEPTYTVEDAVESIGMGWFQLRMYLICGTITGSDALEMMLLAVLSPTVRCEWTLTDSQVALVTTVVFIGMGIASPLLGICGDKYGRKSTLFIVTMSIGYYGLLASTSPSYYWLLFLRGLVGCGMGGSPQGTSLLSEYIPRKQRAKMLIAGQIFWGSGVMFEILLALIVIPQFGWRWLLVASAIPSLCTCLGLLTIPESARYLLAAGYRNKVIQILEHGAKVNSSRLPEGRLVASKEESRGQFSNLFSRDYKRATLQLWFLWFNMGFFYYGAVLISTEILRKYNENGQNHYDCHCRFLSTSDYTTMLISTVGEFAFLPLNWLLIDWLGRRKNAGILLLLGSVLVVLLQFDMPRVPFTVILFGVRGVSSAFGNLLYIYSSEIYPTTIRTLGMGTASAWARVGAMVTPFVAQVLSSYSLTAACCLYSAICLLCSINAFLMPIETMGRVLPQSIHNDNDVELEELNPSGKDQFGSTEDSEDDNI